VSSCGAKLSQRQSRRQMPARPRARPTILFLTRRAMRFGLPEAMVEMSLASRAAAYSCEAKGRSVAIKIANLFSVGSLDER
jgi:hypothetical protein